MAKQYGFSKSEKLKSVVRIERLFTGGRSFWAYPFNVYYRIYNAEDNDAECQLLVSVGKHYFKHAVDRNRVKRLVREAYRLNKTPLIDAVAKSGVHLDLGLVYKSKQISDYKTVETSIKQIMERLAAAVDKNEK